MADLSNNPDLSHDEPIPQQEPKLILEAGEKAFTIVLFVLGLIAFGLALQLWLQMSQPRSASAGALPLFVSILWVVLSFMAILENRKLASPLSGIKAFKERLIKGLSYAIPLEVAVMLGAIFAYCAALNFGLSFYIATPLFLFGGMCYLSKKQFLKNLIWTIGVMAFVVLVFRMLFGVIFP